MLRFLTDAEIGNATGTNAVCHHAGRGSREISESKPSSSVEFTFFRHGFVQKGVHLGPSPGDPSFGKDEKGYLKLERKLASQMGISANSRIGAWFDNFYGQLLRIQQRVSYLLPLPPRWMLSRASTPFRLLSTPISYLKAYPPGKIGRGCADGCKSL